VNNLILSSQNVQQLGNNKFEVISNELSYHLKSILKLRDGTSLKLKVLLPDKAEGLAKVYFDGQQKIKITVISTNEKVLTRKIHLGLATTRPLMAKRILEHATTLGAASFNFFEADLSEKSYFDSKVYKDEVSKKYIYKGMSQCSRYISVPMFNRYESLDLCIKYFKNQNIPLFWLDRDGEATLSEAACVGEVALLIGPERGWTKREVEYFRYLGVECVKLSNSNLRVEFAVSAAFAQLEFIEMSKN